MQAPQCVVSHPMWVPVSREHLADQVDEEQAGLDVGLALLAVDRDA